MACRHHGLLNIDAVQKQLSHGAAVAIRADPSDHDSLAFHHPAEEVAGCIGIRVVISESLHRRRPESRLLLPWGHSNAGEPEALAFGGLAAIAVIAAADGDLGSRCRCCVEPKSQGNTKRARDELQPSSRLQCNGLLAAIRHLSQAEFMDHRVSIAIALAAACFSGSPVLAHGKGIYATAEEAQARALQIGCSTIHQNNGRWMPCADEQELHRQLRRQ